MCRAKRGSLELLAHREFRGPQGAQGPQGEQGITVNTAPNSFFIISLHTRIGYSGTNNVNPLHMFQMPFAATLVEVSFVSRGIDTTDGDETYTIDVEENGTSVLNSAIAITADNTPVVGTISDAAIADNSKIEVILGLGGTTPLIRSPSVLLTFKVAHTD